MARGLQIAEPPRRKSEPVVTEAEEEVPPQPEAKPEERGRGLKFSQIAEHEKVQFNRRIDRGVADGFEMLAIKTRKKVPDLLAEALEMLEERYGKV